MPRYKNIVWFLIQVISTLIYLHRCTWVCCCFSNPWSCTWIWTSSAVNITLGLKVHQLHHPSSTSFVWVKSFYYNMHPTASWFLGGINSTTIQLYSLVWASNRSNHSFCDRQSVQVPEHLIPVLYRTIHNAVFQAPPPMYHHSSGDARMRLLLASSMLLSILSNILISRCNCMACT